MKLSALIPFIIGSILLVGSFIYSQNDYLVINPITYTHARIPSSFNDFTIVHLSDIHNKNFHGRLTKKVALQQPDLIVITGDLMDRRRTDLDMALKQASELVAIAPVYYVSGNHERLSGLYDQFIPMLQATGVTILDQSFSELTRDGHTIRFIGAMDPACRTTNPTDDSTINRKVLRNQLEPLLAPTTTDLQILLCHRPEQFALYQQLGIHLTFSGHAHGGQMRLPFIGPVITPNQGWFPTYTEGIYTENTSSMVVSRGLGNSAFPLRLFNPPEIIVLKLKAVAN